METPLLILLLLPSITLALSASEETRLILHSDTSVIDDRLRELPGGILLPPEEMEREVPKLERLLKKKPQQQSSRRLPAYSTSTSSLLSNTQQSKPLSIALKRIEILSSRAGFNMSALPRRSQLQIVKRLADKLPWKLRSSVQSSLKNNLSKVYELLPEPGRDPVVEDNPMDEDDYLLAWQREEEDELRGEKMSSLRSDEELKSMRPPDLQSSSSNNHQVTMATSSQESNLQITREPNKPIRVSIISKHDKDVTMTTSTTTTTTTEPPPITKYVQVHVPSSNQTQLFQVDSPDYDLSSDEIEAMVNELEKYENNLVNPHELEFPDHPEHPVSNHGDELKRLEDEIKRKQALRGHVRPGGPPPQLPRRPPMMPVRRPPPQHSSHPLRLNDVMKVNQGSTSFHRECDYFTSELCLLVQDYPIEAITSSLTSNPSIASNFLPTEDSSTSSNHALDSKLHSEGGFLCPSKVAYGKVKKAKSSRSGKWKWVVNVGEKYKQTLRMEKCLTPGDRCSYIIPHYRTACTQVYNYHRLLAWDEERGLHTDVFKIPTVCTCHVQGYYHHPFVPPPHPKISPLNNNRRRVMIPQHHHQMMSLPREPLPRLQQQLPHLRKNDDDLGDLLKQYSELRDKIARKQQATTSPSTKQDRMLSLIENALQNVRRKKRRNNPLPSNKKKKMIKKLLKSRRGRRVVMEMKRKLMKKREEMREKKEVVKRLLKERRRKKKRMVVMAIE